MFAKSLLCRAVASSKYLSPQFVKQSAISTLQLHPHHPSSSCLQQRNFDRGIHFTACRNDLMEFFDDKKNWGEPIVKVGRSWRIDELRIRSNTDLHKLWYILLKERNMLMTMEHECKRQCELFPNPGRLDKVEESMENIEAVVRERNRAYYFLETGLSGERPGEEIENFLGLQEYVQHNEYHIPKEENKEYLIAKRDEPKSSLEEKRYFTTRFTMKKRKEARKELRRQQYVVLHTLRNFPHCDIEALKEIYPLVDVDKYVQRINNRHCENLEGMKIGELFHQPFRL